MDKGVGFPIHVFALWNTRFYDTRDCQSVWGRGLLLPVYPILLAGMKKRLYEARASSYLPGNTAGEDGMSRPQP